MKLPENPTEDQIKVVMLEVIQSQVSRGNVQSMKEMGLDEGGALTGIFVMDGNDFKFSYDDGRLVFSPVDSSDFE